MTLKIKGYLCFLFICVSWGTTWVANKYTLNLGISPFQIAWIRHLIGGVLIIVFHFCFLKETRWPNWQEWKWLTIMAWLTFYLSNFLTNVSLKFLPSGFTALIAALYPIVLITIEAYYYKLIKIDFKASLGIALGFLGLATISYYDNFCHKHLHLELNFNFILGILLSFIALISWSMSSIKLTKDKINMNINLSLGWQMFIASWMILISAVFFPKEKFIQLPLKAWWSIGYLIIVGNILSFIAFQISLKTLGMSITSLYAYINPLVTIGLAWIWINEPLTIYTLLGTSITLFGVFLANKSLKDQKKNLKT